MIAATPLMSTIDLRRSHASFSAMTLVTPPSMAWSTSGCGAWMSRCSRTRRPLTISLDELQRHVLICGVTGSGKTVTSFHVLRHLWRDHRVPWLVIEPVKGDPVESAVYLRSVDIRDIRPAIDVLLDQYLCMLTVDVV